MNRLASIALCLVFSTHLIAQQLDVGAEPNGSVPAGPNDSPQWRGTNRDGIAPDKGLIKEWPEGGPNIAWKIDDVGVGYSSVAIKDGLIVTMGDLNGVEHTIALRANDGSRVWAVQPSSVQAELDVKAEREYAAIDSDGDGVIFETEALARFGLEFYKYDKGSSAKPIAQRANEVFASLDSDHDDTLDYDEAGRQLRDQFAKIDSADESKTAELAERRTAALFENADGDSDGEISRKESRGSYLDAIFSKADRRLPDSRKGDQVLTRDEVHGYFSKREAGKDGLLDLDEFRAFYRSNVTTGDGVLSKEELKGLFGGYRNGQGDGPRGTPTIDGDRVYVEGGNGDVACLDLATGQTRWSLNLTEDLGGSRPTWGYSESPLIVNDWVVVTPGGDQGTVAALNKFTGEVQWRSDELTETAHYASPVIATIGGTPQIIQFAKQSAFGVALADGKLLWQYSGANNSTANCCTPIVDNEHVFVASAYGTGGGLAKISVNGSAQTADEVYFEKKMAIHHGGIVKIGDYMYSCGGGTLICIDFLTGEIVWQDRSIGKGSLTAADGMLYVLSERQELALVEATPDGYREHGKIKLESQGRPSWAHPVVAGGRLYLRDQNTLTAYELR